MDVNVQTKTLRERATPPKDSSPTPVIDFADRAFIDVSWYSRLTGEHHEFNGVIRVLGVNDLLRAASLFNRVVGSVPYETIPSEIRNRVWPQVKLMTMFEEQDGGRDLVDACDTDKLLLVSVMQEVDRLEAECFRGVLAASEGVEGTPRVVVATRRTASSTTPSSPPR